MGGSLEKYLFIRGPEMKSLKADGGTKVEMLRLKGQ